MTDSPTQLPRQIAFDLDSAQRPEDEVKPPFVANVHGREITMEDPDNLDWRDLILMEKPTEFLRLALSKEDRKFLLEQSIEGWRFNQLMEAYYSHYDLEDKLQQAHRQQRLSSV
jgi:hypothetical protein